VRRVLVLLAMFGLLSLGATAQVDCPGPAPVFDLITIEVVNSTPVAIEAIFATSDDPFITQDELLEFGDLSVLTVPAGEVDSFDLFCDEAAALILDQANLLVSGGGSIGTNILYLDEDYFCGEIISFEFFASQDLFELDVEVTFFEP